MARIDEALDRAVEDLHFYDIDFELYSPLQITDLLASLYVLNADYAADHYLG